MQANQIGILILAAGGSKRLGFPKQLLYLNGQSLLKRVIGLALQIKNSAVLTILGAYAEQLKPEIEDLPVRVLLNEEWENGQSTSVKMGVEALSSCDAVLILVTDQVALNKRWLSEFLQAAASKSSAIWMAEYGNGVCGVPLFLPQRYFGLVDKLHGDQGIKRVLRQERMPFSTFFLPDGELDVDRESDLKALHAKGYFLRR